MTGTSASSGSDAVALGRLRVQMGAWHAAVVMLLLACDRNPAPAPSAGAGVARASCAGLGPASCDRPPSTSAGLCASLAGCVRDDTGNLNLDGLTLDCRRDPFEAPPETAFTAKTPALAGTGVRATSIVNVVASEDDAMRFGAAYLVAELAEGSCIVDNVLPWGSSYADTEIATRWESAPTAPPRLHVRAHRTTFTVLDQEELARGESNVTSEICARRSYDVAGGRFVRSSQGETDGKCPVTP
jgi:hypothetical protein